MKMHWEMKMLGVMLLSVFLLFGCGSGGSGGQSTDSGNPPVVPVVQSGGQSTDSGNPPVVPVVHTAFTVNGTAGRSVTDGTNVFVVTLRDQDVYLTKFDAAGNKLWEKTVLATADYDECHGIALMDGFVYLLCVHDDPTFMGNNFPSNTGIVFLEKINAASGQLVEVKLSDLAATLGLIADPATHTLYACYGANLAYIVRLDADGNILASALDSPGGPTGQFSGIMVAGNDALYSVGSVLQGGTLNRIKVIKYTKDLSEIGSVQYRNFSDSQDLDMPKGGVLSPDGRTLFVMGAIDVFAFLTSSSTRNVIFKVDVTSGTITDATDLGPATSLRPADMAFGSSGVLYGILNESAVKVNVTTMAVTSLGIGATDLTMDAANVKVYVSNGGNTVSVYDLGGNQL